MKLSGIFIICALVTEASALECFSCVDPTGNCTQKEAVCDPDLNLTCKTTLITQTVGARNTSRFVKGCGICPEPTSFNSGFVAQTVGSSCCSSDLCNDQRHEVMENTTLNGLECFGCFNDSAETCASSTSIPKCVGIQNRCYHDLIRVNASKSFVLKGCASENICRQTESSSFGVQLTSDTFCCKDNLCNKETTLPGLQCHSCVGVAGVCKPLTIQCTSSSCRSLHLKEVTGGSTQDTVINGCGNCTGILSFSRGSAFSVDTADRCCQSDLCNNQTITVKANSTLNGLECYGCSATSNQACENSKETVKCVGEQKWCLHLSGTRRTVLNVTMKGCASESICKNPDVVKAYEINPNQEFYCCKGSGCNRGRERPLVSTAQTTTAADTTTAAKTTKTTSASPAVQQDLTLLTLSLIALIPCLF